MTTTSRASSAEDYAGLLRRVQDNLSAIRSRIEKAGADPERVRVVGVTKTFGADAVRAAVAAGLDAVGENYVGELETKRAALVGLDVRWHFLGHLQSNKISRVAQSADVICSISRPKELDRLASLSCASRLYVQLDLTGEVARSGAPPREVPGLVQHARDAGLNVVGLMCVAPPEPEGTERAFATTRDLADECGLAVRSMGMSDDLEVACRYGTTEVRIGRGLFGPRAPLRGAPSA